MGRTLLVLGSSVCTGAGATMPELLGWHAKLAAALSPLGVELRNIGVGGTTVRYWSDELTSWGDEEEDFSLYDVVLMSLSLGNEGLPGVSAAAAIARIRQEFTEGYRTIAHMLRAKMRPGARLVIGGPYPNSDYTAAHLDALSQIYADMRQWEHVDHIIDFLQPVVHKGEGRWHDDAWRDPGHPNDLGHDQMFRCLDIEGILGAGADVGAGASEACGGAPP